MKNQQADVSHGNSIHERGQKGVPTELAEGRVHQAVGWAREKLEAVEEQTRQVHERATDLLDGAKERVVPVNEWVHVTGKEHPYLLVGASVGVGLLTGSLLGALIRRSK